MPGTATVDRGQVGVGTLVVFISMVLVAAIAAGVLVNTAEFLRSTDDGPGTGPTPDHAPPLEVVAVTGEDIADGRIGDLVLVVKTTPGAGEVDLRDVTIRWVGPDGADRLGYDATPGFEAEVRRDADGSWPVLDDPADRAAIALDLDDDGSTVTGTTVAPIGTGDAVTIVITTERGATVEVDLEVPPSLGSAPTIDL